MEITGHVGVLLFLLTVNGVFFFSLLTGKLVTRQTYSEIVYLAVKEAIKELRDSGYL